MRKDAQQPLVDGANSQTDAAWNSSLRKFNIGACILHFVQGGLMLVASQAVRRASGLRRAHMRCNSRPHCSVKKRQLCPATGAPRVQRGRILEPRQRFP